MKKYTKEELYKMDAIDVYKMVLRGDVIKIFPAGFWQQPEAMENAAKCTRYLVEEILGYDEDAIKQKINQNAFTKNKLTGMIQTCFSSSPFEAISNAYPGKFKPWEFSVISMGFWKNKENGIMVTRWLIEERLGLNDDELREQLSVNMFVDNGLSGMLRQCFNNSPFDAINSVYPDRFKEWEFKHVPLGYWKNKENGVKATRWLVEEKLKLDEQQLKEQLSIDLFKENGLGGMLSNCFDDSPFKAINYTYPGKFKEWEFKMVPSGYWKNKENGVKATRWLIEEHLKLSEEQLKEQLSKELFADNGLSGMLQYSFNNSPFLAINSLYPGKFKEWEFNSVPKGYWNNKKNAMRAVRWLIEEHLKLSEEQLKEQLSKELFADNGLSGMLQYSFNNSPFLAINSLYPGKFKKEDFKNYR